ncbi:MAG: AAA family ATPase [Pyrinomonadaceae bacterium]
MYKEFYGFEEMPFTLTPDPRFLVFTPSYNEVLATLYYGLENDKGMIVLTGEVGTGKTTALRWILRRLDSSVLAAYVFNPRLSVEDFYQQLGTMLDLKEWETKAELLTLLGETLEERHRLGLKTVLILDEAHELSDYVLEEIRLLLNFESDTAKHLQIVLTGQPELRNVLNKPNLRQLKQRVALRCHIHALPNQQETERYITERLLLAGSTQPIIFTPDAVDYIFLVSEGIPRQINNLCDNALLAGYAASEMLIGREIIEKVANNLDLLPRALISETEPSNLSVARLLTEEGRAELINGSKSKTETINPVTINQNSQ